MKQSKEEEKLLKSVEADEWKPVPDAAHAMGRYQEMARATLRKDKRVNIRMTERDLLHLKHIAIEEGLPYQTLMSSILHKYINGRLVDETSQSG